MTVKGIDVSSYQPADYSTRGLNFVFIKITEGTSYTNPKWVDQRATARKAGLVTGFYHFIRPGSVTKQADYFLSKIKLAAGDILALDWEDRGVSSAEKDTWIKYVQREAPGHRVVLYCNQDFWLNRDTSSFAGDGLWIAQYNGRPGHPDIQAPWLFHQYTSTPIDTSVGDFTSRAALRDWARGTAMPEEDQEDDMQLNDQITLGSWVPEKWPKDTGLSDGKIAVNTALGSGYAHARAAAENTAAILAQLGALQGAVAALAKGGGITAEQVQAAAEAGARAALAELGDALGGGQ